MQLGVDVLLVALQYEVSLKPPTLYTKTEGHLVTLNALPLVVPKGGPPEGGFSPSGPLVFPKASP